MKSGKDFLNYKIKTTNLRVGHSNRSGRAIRNRGLHFLAGPCLFALPVFYLLPCRALGTLLGKFLFEGSPASDTGCFYLLLTLWYKS